MRNGMINQMETSDGILLSDWDVVKAVATDYANAVVDENHKYMALSRRKMLRLLNRMSKKYGERPSILAIKADYVASYRRREDLLELAYALAQQISDFQNITLVSSSLAEFYVEEMPSEGKGKLWVGRLRRALQDHFDQSEQEVYKRLFGIVKILKGPGSHC